MAAPTLADVKAYLGATSYTDDEISGALAVELEDQASKCRVPDPFPAVLAEAVKRRVARNLALRPLPLAVLQGDAESGSLTVPVRDPEIRRLEARYRRWTVG